MNLSVLELPAQLKIILELDAYPFIAGKAEKNYVVGILFYFIDPDPNPEKIWKNIRLIGIRLWPEFLELLGKTSAIFIRLHMI